MDMAGLAHTLADFAVWDNDGLYALVTVVSIVFTVTLIIMVMRKSREHDAVSRSKTTASPVRLRAAQLRAAASEQAMMAAQPAATEPPATPSPAPHHGQ